MRIACIPVLAIAVGHATAKRLPAQQPEQVSGEVTCAECVITLDTVVTIGGLDGPGVDDRGLWLTWHTADPDWSGPPPSPDTLRPSTFDADALRDGWVDLVDPSTGRTLARHHQDKTLGKFVAGSGYLVDYEETEAGVPFLHLLKPRLSRR